MSNQENNNNSEIPKVGHATIPLWIKIMWVLGVSWVIGYIFWGLQNTPRSW